MTTSLISSGKMPAPANPGRRERKRTETRERIFRAALELFAQQGFFETTVEEITEAADVGKGTFFNYFPSKEHVLGMLHEVQLSKVAQAEATARSSKLPIREVLRQFMRSIAEEPARSQLLARGLLATIFTNDAIRELLVNTMARGRDSLEAILALGQERGEVRRDLPLEAMARTFQQNVIGAVMLWSLNPPSSLAKRIDDAFEIYWSGISPIARKPTEKKS